MWYKKIVYLFLFLVIFCLPSYALDWKTLHKKAAYTRLDQVVIQVKRNPTDSKNLYLLGLAYLNANEPDKAEVIFKELSATYPEMFEAQWGLSEAASRRGDLAGSEKILVEIVNRHPEFTPAQISLAYIKFNQKNYDKTLEIVTAILNQGKNAVGEDAYRRAYLLFVATRGMIINRNGPIVKFIYSEDVTLGFASARSYMPKSAQVYFGIGVFLLMSPPAAGGNLERAHDYLLAAINIDPKSSDSYARLAQIYKILGSQSGFQKYLNKALKIDPQNQTALDIKNKISHFTCITG